MDDRHDFSLSDLAELVGSRLCHDLVNPLSAIANGMELIGLSGAPRTPELELIGAAIDDAMARIRFFRVAFGAARPGETLSERELREIVTAIYGSGRLAVDWQIAGELLRRDAKLAFLLLNCAETALPLGGALTILRDGDGWRVAGEGRKLSLDAALWQMLDPAMMADLSPPASRVQFALLARETAQRACAVQLTPDAEAQRFELRIAPA